MELRFLGFRLFGLRSSPRRQDHGHDDRGSVLDALYEWAGDELTDAAKTDDTVAT